RATRATRPRLRKPLKRLDRNFSCMGSQKLHVILGRKAATADFRQRKAYAPTKKACFLFGDVAFARLRPS
ncbi:MAG: hypothetical protein J6B12_03430, partial [Clostridia bacterium]|nr:hypothetical protein [Clostridia bacterium]